MKTEMKKAIQLGDIWYRYDYTITTSGVWLYLSEYRVEKLTPKGFWLAYAYGDYTKHFILRDSRKKYAWPTKEEALESFRRRKEQQVRILERQLKNAKAAYMWAEHEQGKQIDKGKLAELCYDSLDMIRITI